MNLREVKEKLGFKVCFFKFNLYRYTPAYWNNYHHNGLWKPKVVFTIHNMNYGQAKIGQASHHAQLTTTVSPSYAGEVSGHPAVNGNLHKFHGVRNGIDPELWDPETDQFLPFGYNAGNHEEGKRRARNALQERLGLEWGSDAPIVAVVSRLTGQKGLDLIKHSVGHAVMRGAQYVLLGSAPDPKVQGDFNALANQHRGPNCGFCFAFDEPLSHLVYAAADIILVPSMFEPCGLTQMISMRYGGGCTNCESSFTRSLKPPGLVTQPLNLLSENLVSQAFCCFKCCLCRYATAPSRWCAPRGACGTRCSTWTTRRSARRGRWTAPRIGRSQGTRPTVGGCAS
jgi:glycosyltransferase involved in cell wall biosynthesis